MPRKIQESGIMGTYLGCLLLEKVLQIVYRLAGILRQGVLLVHGGPYFFRQPALQQEVMYPRLCPVTSAFDVLS